MTDSLTRICEATRALVTARREYRDDYHAEFRRRWDDGGQVAVEQFSRALAPLRVDRAIVDALAPAMGLEPATTDTATAEAFERLMADVRRLVSAIADTAAPNAPGAR